MAAHEFVQGLVSIPYKLPSNAGEEWGSEWEIRPHGGVSTSNATIHLLTCITYGKYERRISGNGACSKEVEQNVSREGLTQH